MAMHRVLSVLLIGLAVATVACRPTAKEKEQLSDSIKKDLAALQSEKAVIDERLRDIKSSSQRTRDELESIRHSIETIENALSKIQTRLNAMEAVPSTSPLPPKRLPVAISVVLVVVILFCVLALLKLRSMRARDAAKSLPQEAGGGSGAGSSQAGTPNP